MKTEKPVQVDYLIIGKAISIIISYIRFVSFISNRLKKKLAFFFCLLVVKTICVSIQIFICTFDSNELKLKIVLT